MFQDIEDFLFDYPEIILGVLVVDILAFFWLPASTFYLANAILYLVMFMISTLPDTFLDRSSAYYINRYWDWLMYAGVFTILTVMFFTIAIYLLGIGRWIIILMIPVVLHVSGDINFHIQVKYRSPNTYGHVSKTSRGEIVRSKGEKKIADWLYHNGYDYEYEQKVTEGDLYVFDDFYLVDEDIHIEYFGLEDAPGIVGKEYRERTRKKFDFYDRYGYEMIPLFPEDLDDLESSLGDEIERIFNQDATLIDKIIRYILS